MHIIAKLLVVLAIVTLVTAALLWDFFARSKPPDANAGLPRTAIVFTGQYDRIHKGLDLLSAGRFDQLFITGANRDGGVLVSQFAEQFELTTQQVEWLAAGRIVLAPDADSTLENARETVCWLDRQPQVTAVTLITSQGHMARASLALQRAIAPVRVIRFPSDPSDDEFNFQEQLPEFRRFLKTWALTLLPGAFWPVDEPALCRAAGPTGQAAAHM